MSFQPSQQYPAIYRGSVKDLRGPIEFGTCGALLFDYTDAYSVFDWGRMPDALTDKGRALALIAAHWFEQLERPETWREYSKTPDATALRRGSRFGSVFNELGEELQATGIQTHYYGVLPENAKEFAPRSLRELSAPSKYLVVQAVSVVRPDLRTVLGRSIPDYLPTRMAPLPRLIPLEVVFRFSCPEGSSLIERAKRDPGYMSSIGFGDYTVEPGAKWEFPVLEVFTKLETSDRPVSLVEALAISGISGAQMEKMLLQTAWVAGWLRSQCARAGIELADGKLEWALSDSGGLVLVDAIGPDELRLLKDRVQLSKEFLRQHYRKTSWYEAVGRAKELGQAKGIAEWKKFVAEPVPPLPAEVRELAVQLYPALANALTGKRWFERAKSLDEVVKGIRELS